MALGGITSKTHEVAHSHACASGAQLHFMDPETYEQETVAKELFGDLHDYCREELQVNLRFYEGEVVAGK